MKRKHPKLIAIALSVLLVVVSCSKKEDPEAMQAAVLAKYLNVPAAPFNYAHPILPDFFNGEFVTIQDNTPADNPVTDWGATLGRVLFYDKQLSRNNSIACNSCHAQQFGFSDTAQFSRGFGGGLSRRHSMGLVNTRYYINGRFFWDERAASLEEQVLMPVQDSVEMGMRLDSLEARLKASEFYPVLFRHAFGDAAITRERIAKALAQFVRAIVSYRSKYDVGRSLTADREADFPNYTAEENRGKSIFMKALPVNCFGCHNTDVFITDNPRNNGNSLSNEDAGIFAHTGDPLDLGKFKAPSLKNVALRGRYMHDGKFAGLDAVLHHYNEAIQANANLDPHIMVNGAPARMNLSATDLHALKAFLETLTDEALTRDPKFSSPFR